MKVNNEYFTQIFIQIPYWYVNNNPIRFTEPDGRCPQKPDGCYTDIQKVVIGSTRKTIVAPPSGAYAGPSFLSGSLSSYFDSGSGSSGSGGGGGGSGAGFDPAH